MRWVVWLTALALLSPSAPAAEELLGVVPSQWVQALEEGRWGEVETLLEAEDVTPLQKGEAQLALDRPNEALAVLGPLLAEDPRAALLAARAALELDGQRARDARVEAALARATCDRVGEVLAFEAIRRRLALLDRLDRPDEVRALARALPEAEWTDEVRWLAARAVADPVAARAALWEIWWSAPSSTWALEARRRVRDLDAELDTERGTELAWSPSVEEHLDFVDRLQRAGLHGVALEELERIEAGRDGERALEAKELEELLRRRAVSAYRTRRNELCVATFDRLRTLEGATADALLDAGVFALRALRRSDLTDEIRERATWLETELPGRAAQATFQLGDHLGNVRDPAEGLKVLDRVVASRERIAAEALWKGAWLARGLGDASGARERFESLARRFASTAWAPAAWYWMGRLASDAEGRKLAWDELLEVDPHGYYGRLARERLERGDSHLSPEEVVVPRVTRPGPEPAALRRARDLAAAHLSSLALLEVESLARRDPGLELVRARLEARSGRPHRAVEIVESSLRPWRDRDDPAAGGVLWRLSLPLWPRPDTFAAEATEGEEGVDPLLVLGVMRQESRYRARAVSSAGALGLLQLMPETAAELARSLGLPKPGREDLFRPEVNVRLGVEELRLRIEDWDGAWVPAIAAYNAGASVVRTWWEERPADQELDEWIETIPYRETRLYVKRVLENWALYHEVWGEPVSILGRLRSDGEDRPVGAEIKGRSPVPPARR